MNALPLFFLALLWIGSAAEVNNLNFPIVLPPYNQDGAKDPLIRREEWGSCLLYLESISVIVFNPASKEMTSAAAIVNGGEGHKNTFAFEDSFVSCLKNGTERAGKKWSDKAKEFSFKLDVTLNSPISAKKAKDASGGGGGELFSVTGPLTLTLTFEVKADNTWHLSKVQADSLKVKSGSWLKQDLSVKRDSKEGKRVEMSRMGGNTPSTAYACSSTQAIIFDTDQKEYTIGVAFNNLQVQPYGVLFKKGEDGKALVKFGRRVDDCIGTFSAGSWMGVVVFLLLLFVLLMSYLMLNSVQTMDRFDDPKQKQIIISAKE